MQEDAGWCFHSTSNGGALQLNTSNRPKKLRGCRPVPKDSPGFLTRPSRFDRLHPAMFRYVSDSWM